MTAVTKVYPDAGATAIFTVFQKQVTLRGVYSVTEMLGRYYINSIYYPFHFEVTDTEITITEQVAQPKQYYTTEVD